MYLDSADSQWFVIANLKRPISPDSLIQSTQFQAEETNKKGTPPWCGTRPQKELLSFSICLCPAMK